SPEVGTTLGHQSWGACPARGAGISGEEPSGRSSLPQFDAEARAGSHWQPAALGMAERREPFRGEARGNAKSTTGNAGNQPDSSLGQSPYSLDGRSGLSASE